MADVVNEPDISIEVSRAAEPRPGPEERALLQTYLSRDLPEVPPRYFYDDVGSELFEQITRLPSYYQTRTELKLLERYAAEIMGAVGPRQVVELGSGAGRKIRTLLDAWGPSPRGKTCVMLDINELFLRQSLTSLAAGYPSIRFRGVVGDFVRDLGRLGPPGGRLVVFFAGTIGNLYPAERAAFLRALSAAMDPTDSLLLGVDLVKDPARLEAAYDDPQGVTAAFNLNMLSVVNRRFDADFNPSDFRHRAFYDRESAWIEMRLVAVRPAHVTLRALPMEIDLPQGAELRTEISCKFTRESLALNAAEAGLSLSRWCPDPDGLFALGLLRKEAP